jgi:hypothetical protein
VLQRQGVAEGPVLQDVSSAPMAYAQATTVE